MHGPLTTGWLIIGVGGTACTAVHAYIQGVAPSVATTRPHYFNFAAAWDTYRMTVLVTTNHNLSWILVTKRKAVFVIQDSLMPWQRHEAMTVLLVFNLRRYSPISRHGYVVSVLLYVRRPGGGRLVNGSLWTKGEPYLGPHPTRW